MTKHFSKNELDLWKKATSICESLIDYTPAESIELVKKMHLHPDLYKKVSSIIEKQAMKSQIFEDISTENIISNANNESQLINSNIDEYRIKKLIAKSGMSSVYLAEYNKEGYKKDVAIKFLSPYGTSKKSIELFTREQRILSTLNHPNIVSFHHSGQTKDGARYLVMEYIPGAKEITQYCLENNCTHNQVIDYIIQLCEILSYTHNEQVIHRDIKPSNILINEHGQLKVIDFGIGRFDSVKDITSTYVFTIESASPEQILRLDITAQTDVFSLGAMFLELLTGKKPLPKTNIQNYNPNDDTKHVNKLLQTQPFDTDLKNIIKKAMHFERELRYINMDKFAEDLTSWKMNKPVSAAGDSYLYILKKSYIRNKASILFSITALFIIFSSLLVIKFSNIEKRFIEGQKEKSFALVNAMFDQIDPLKNKGIGKNDEITQYLDQLTPKTKALIESDPEIEYLYYNRLLSIYQNQGRLEPSLNTSELALAALLKFTSKNDERYIKLKISSLHQIESMGQHEKALEQGLEYYNFIEQQHYVKADFKLDLLYLFNKIYSSQGKINEALQVVQKADIWIKNHPEIEARLISTMMNSMAVVYRQNGQTDLAEAGYLKSIDILSRLPETEIKIAAIYSNLAVLNGINGNYSESEYYFQKAITLYQTIDPTHIGIADTNLSYSTLHHFTGNLDKAIQAALESLEILKIYDDKIRIGDVFRRLVNFELSRNNISQAIQYSLSGFENHLADSKNINHSIFKLISPTFSVLSFEEFRTDAVALNDLITAGFVESKKMKSYHTYNFQKALLNINHEPLKPPESILIEYNNMSSFDESKKLIWLETNINSITKKQNIIAVWLELEKIKLLPNESHLNELCNIEQNWVESSLIFLKHETFNKCLSFGRELSEKNAHDIENLTSLIKSDINQNKAKIKNTIDEILKLLTEHPQIEAWNY